MRSLADIVSGRTDLADVAFLAGAILGVVAAVVGRESAVTVVLGIAVAAIATGLLVL